MSEVTCRPVRDRVDDLREGFVAALPLAPGVMTFGMVYGLTSRQVGLMTWQSWLMSLTVFAGAAQFAALQVWATAAAGQIILLTLVVNLRYLLLGASISRHLQGLSWGQKAFAVFMLSDESYALAMARYASGQGSVAYLLGANCGLYVQWALASLAGAALATAMPELTSYRLDLVFPLAFLGMLGPMLDDRIHLAIAAVAGAGAWGAASLLSGSWHVLIAGLGGGALGVVLERRWKRS